MYLWGVSSSADGESYFSLWKSITRTGHKQNSPFIGRLNPTDFRSPSPRRLFAGLSAGGYILMRKCYFLLSAKHYWYYITVTMLEKWRLFLRPPSGQWSWVSRMTAVRLGNRSIVRLTPIFQKPRLFIYTNLRSTAKMRVEASPAWREVSGGSAWQADSLIRAFSRHEAH